MSAAVTPQPSQTEKTPPPASPEAGGGVIRFQTARDWLNAIGAVPLERIVFDPWPGTATEADVLRLGDHEDRRCELVHGTLVEKTVGFVESMIAFRIAYLIGLIIIPRKLGVATVADGTIRLIRQQVRMPDVAYFPFARLPDGRVPNVPIPAIVPDLAVEVLSESNARREMELKLTEYFEAGTRLVWYVDPPTRTVAVYTAPGEPTTLTDADRLTGGDVLAGFDVAVADVFDGQ